ncbi:MAG: amidohydrolase [Gemmatimonadetes bacterium]|nr:amidohydrolase [Gemmatimonadota bacterium]
MRRLAEPDQRATRGAWAATVACALLLAIAAGCRPAAAPVDLVLLNGRVVTVDAEVPEAEAVAMAGDTIVAVGSTSEIQRYVGPNTEVLDLEGQLAIPGFIEGHGHFLNLGRSKMILDLTTARTWDDIVAMVADAASRTPPGEWIQGRGWHQEKWDPPPAVTVDGVPLHHDLSRVTPNHPVFLTHASGHAGFVNAKAMEVARVTRRTANPPGGEIVKDERGEPTGLMRETAQRLVSAAMEAATAGRSPEDIRSEMHRQVELAGEEALANGVTTFHDAGSNFATIDFLRGLAEAGELPLRLYVMVRRESNEVMAEKLPQYRMIGAGNGFLTVRAIKRQIDGALGSHGAWLLEPYVDLPTSSGLTLETVEDIRRTAEIAIQNGFQVNTHAIGDRGNREVLDIYEQVFRANPDKTDVRWRIEHAQHLHPADIPRFGQLGVIASMQGVHCTSDGPWVPERIGEERARTGAYMWRSLIDAGAVVTNGTDVPVEKINPIASFHASVTRRLADGRQFFPEQRMTREEALRSYTINNAYAAFEEDVKGSITRGKLADIVVLSRDIMTVPEDEIPTAQVVYTILGGEVLYRRTAMAQ